MDAALLAEAIWFNLFIIVSLQTSKFSKFVTRVIVLQRKCVFHFFHADPTITADCSSDTTLELSKNKINSPVGTGGGGNYWRITLFLLQDFLSGPLLYPHGR